MMYMFMRDVASVFLGGLLAMIVYAWLTKEYYYDPYAEYVPSIEGFERMDIQSPDFVNYKRGTLDKASQ